MANANSTYDLKVEKLIPKSPAEVFRAIGQGRLFLNCSADQELLKIDFQVGGKYSIEFLSYNMKNQGEFLEIIPNKKIVFTWCQDFDTHPTPDTTVTVELKDQDGKTALTLTHTGFTDLENKNAHEGGWSGGLDDLSQEITNGKIRLVRVFKFPVETLYEICKIPASFLGLMGDFKKGEFDFKVGGQYRLPSEKGELKGTFLEIVPNQKIVLSWLKSPCGEPLTRETKVTLIFEAEDDKANSSLELIHEGLETESQQMAHRGGWDSLLKRINK